MAVLVADGKQAGQAAAGLKISNPIWQGDIFATVAAYVGAELPATTPPDGESFVNLIRGHAVIQNLWRGHYELGTETTTRFRIQAAFEELAPTL